jgi:hypothetical protein
MTRMQGAPVNSFRKQDGRFMPGTSGNPNGRPRGSLNRRTLATLAGIEAARGEADSPLAAMLRAMDFFDGQARDLLAAGPLPDAAGERERQARIGESFMSAALIARMAAPYLHARLSPTEIVDPAPTERKFVFSLNLGEPPSLPSPP